MFLKNIMIMESYRIGPDHVKTGNLLIKNSIKHNYRKAIL